MSPSFSARLCLVIALAALACGPSPVSSSPSSGSSSGAAPDVTRVPTEVASAVAAGAPTRVLVLLDREQVAPQVLAADALLSTEMATDRVVQFAGAKQDLFASGPDELELVQDFEQLPIAFAELRSADALAHLANDPRVLRVVPDVVFTTSLAESLPLINQPAAAADGKDGTGTAIAVLDTGADYRVADLGSCTAVGLPASCRVVYAADFATQDNQLDDSVRHGTNTSSISARVAPGAKIIPLDVFDGQGASSSVIINAINWVIANRATYNIASMNLSLGGGSYTSNCDSDPMAIAIAEARKVGVLAAVATGNSGTLNAISSPACSSAAVSVGAVWDSNLGGMSFSACSDSTTAADKVTCFSNAASFQTLLAPGAMISAGGVTMAGTSQATPHVAGAIAVLHGAFPNETPTELVTRLTSTGKPVTDARTGRVVPRLDLAAAATGCVLRVTPSTSTVPSAGGSTTLTLSASSGCAWTASASDTWLTLSPSSGTGSATVTLTAAANSGALRSGTATFAASGAASATASLSQGVDTSAPTGTVIINGGATWTKTTTVALTLTAVDPSGVAGMCVSNTTSCTSYETFVTSKVWTLAAANGLQTVRVFLKDSRGNVSLATTAPSGKISLDTGLPTGAVATATYGDGSISLSWTAGVDATSGIDHYKVVYATGTTAPASCATGSVAYEGSDRTFTHQGLTNGTTYTYRVCALDKAGNFSAGSVVAALPRPESVGPVASLVINGGATATNSLTVQLGISGTDDSSIAQQCVSSVATCTAWETYAPTRSFTLPNRQGPISLYLRLKDQWGNVSAAAATSAIIFDNVAPTGGALRATYGDASATLTWTAATDATSGVAGYKVVYATGTTPPANCSAGTTAGTVTASPFVHTGLTNGTTYAWRVCAFDGAGNLATGITATTMPKPESVGPVGTVVINGGATSTRTAAVTVSLSASDDSQVASMCVSLTATCTAWQTFASSKSVTLANAQGSQKVYASFKDQWGNVSAAPASASILFDNVAPTGGALSVSAGDASSTLTWTSSTDVTTGVASYTVVYAVGTTAPASCAAGTLAGSVVASPFVHSGLTNGTHYAYRVCAVDAAGNVATGMIASTMPKPESLGPVGTVVLNGGAAWTRTVAVTATLTAADASTVTRMCVSTAATCTAWVAYASTATVTLSATAGQKTVNAWFMDQWGNVSASTSATIGLDTTAPTQPALTASASSGQVSLSWAEATDSGSGVAGYKLVALSGTTLPAASCTTGTVLATSGTTFVDSGLTGGTARAYRLCALDAAGNTSTGATATATPLR